MFRGLLFSVIMLQVRHIVIQLSHNTTDCIRWPKTLKYYYNFLCYLTFQCYISTGVWLVLLFVYFHNMQCGAVWQLVLIFVERSVDANHL